MKNILIVDDHLVVLTGVTIILEENFKDINIFTTENFTDTILSLKENKIDLIILDINIPGGKNLGMIPEIRNLQPDAKILIFSVYHKDSYACQYIIAGANGYLNKLSNKETIVEAIESVLKTGSYYPANIVNAIISMSNTKQIKNPLDKLSKRELEISELLLEGNGNIEIANKLNIGMTTVSTHKNKIFNKLNIKNIVELISISNRSMLF